MDAKKGKARKAVTGQADCDVSWDEFLNDLSLAAPDNAGATIAEIAEATGLCTRTVHKKMLAAKKQGLIAVSRSHRESLDGIMRLVPVYRPVKR